ncbi:medium-chain acyl-CoA ligase ACSF2, mitochondrial-like [Glandiceps talaboti]
MARCFKPKTSYLHSASSIPFTGITLCDALDRSAENSPDKEAFVFASKPGSKRITYRQLRQDVIKLAAGLLHLGLKPGDRVGIWFENRYEWILTQYATAYTKMMYVSFLAGYNAEYMEYLINKTKVSTLVMGTGDQEKVLGELVPKISKAGTRCIEADNIPTLRRIIHLGAEEKAGISRFIDICELGEERDFQQVMKIRNSVQQDDEITMLFTSGSTGMPKTVVKSHRCLVENMHTCGRHIADMVNKDVARYISTIPFAHAAADAGTVMAVIWGFTAIIPEPKCDSLRVAELIQQERATFAFLMFHSLFDFINDPRLQSHDFSSIELILTAGNVVPKEVLDKVRGRVTPNLLNVIGSTEAGFQTFHNKNEKYDRVGLPVNHQEIKIIDDGGNIVPLFTTGELCIRSNYILLRYEGDEEKTKDIDGSGWFHTGDLSLMEEDGCLHVMGRKKDIIIKGGRNIYPLEIERVLMQHPKVKLPQVVSVPDERLVEEICACICLEKNQEATEDEILEFVRPILEEFLVPKYVLFFDSYPSSLTGKIMRTELAKKARERLGLNK